MIFLCYNYVITIIKNLKVYTEMLIFSHERHVLETLHQIQCNEPQRLQEPPNKSN